MKKVILTGLTAAMLSSGAFASEVTAGSDTTLFSSGSPAVAADVNANFAALIAAINDNSARIDALISSSVTGKSYLYREMTLFMTGQRYGSSTTFPTGATSVPGGYARTNMISAEITLVFNSNGTVDISGTEAEVELWVNMDSNVGLQPDSFSASGTWTQLNNVVTVDLGGGDVFDFQVSAGGEVITVMDQVSLRDSIFSHTDENGSVYTQEYEMLLGFGTALDAPAP